MNTLDYATDAGRRRFDPTAWPSVPTLLAVVIVSAFLSITVSRMVPGGPFISIHGDVVPVAGCAIAFHLAWRSLKPSSTGRQIALTFIMVACVAIIVFKTIEVSEFWARPYARGALVSW